jgi:hypothetical protein
MQYVHKDTPFKPIYYKIYINIINGKIRELYKLVNL